MTEINTKNAAFKYLSDSENLTAVVGTASASGEPHAAVVYYAVEDDLSLYFLTATGTQKSENLAANPRVSVAVGFGPGYVTMQGVGNAALLEKGSGAEHHAVALIKNRLFDCKLTWPLFQMNEFDGESVQVFKVTLDSLYFLNLEQDNGLTVTTESFQKVI